MRRLNPFGVKLMLALALTVIIAVGALVLALNRAASRQFSHYVIAGMMHRAETLVPVLAEYYSQHGGWEGVEGLLIGYALPAAGRGAMHGRGPVLMGGGLILTDGDGRVLVDSITADATGRTLSAQALTQSLDIVVEGAPSVTSWRGRAREKSSSRNNWIARSCWRGSRPGQQPSPWAPC